MVKRGWTARMIPNALQPRIDAVWGAIVALAAVFYALDMLDRRRTPGPSRAVLT